VKEYKLEEIFDMNKEEESIGLKRKKLKVIEIIKGVARDIQVVSDVVWKSNPQLHTWAKGECEDEKRRNSPVNIRESKMEELNKNGNKNGKNSENRRKSNPKARMMSYVLQEIEHVMIGYVVEYLQARAIIDKDFPIATLCYDGILVYQHKDIRNSSLSIFNNRLLKEISEYVYEKTSYKMTFDYKKMEKAIDTPMIYSLFTHEWVVKAAKSISKGVVIEVNEKPIHMISDNKDILEYITHDRDVEQPSNVVLSVGMACKSLGISMDRWIQWAVQPYHVTMDQLKEWNVDISVMSDEPMDDEEDEEKQEIDVLDIIDELSELEQEVVINHELTMREEKEDQIVRVITDISPLDEPLESRKKRYESWVSRNQFKKEKIEELSVAWVYFTKNTRFEQPSMTLLMTLASLYHNVANTQPVKKFVEVTPHPSMKTIQYSKRFVNDIQLQTVNIPRGVQIGNNNYHHIQSIIQSNRDTVDVISTKALVINSTLNTGKSTLIHKIINRHSWESILVITPRISYAQDRFHTMNKKCVLKDNASFSLYKDIPYSLGSEKYLICSMESLFRIGLTIKYELVILDEVESNLTQLTSATMGKQMKKSVKILEYIMLRCTQVIMSDAYTHQRTLNMCMQLKIPYTFVNNTYSHEGLKMKRISAKNTDKVVEWIKEYTINKRKRLYVVVASLNRSNELKEKLLSDSEHFTLAELDADTSSRDPTDMEGDILPGFITGNILDEYKDNYQRKKYTRRRQKGRAKKRSIHELYEDDPRDDEMKDELDVEMLDNHSRSRSRSRSSSLFSSSYFSSDSLEINEEDDVTTIPTNSKIRVAVFNSQNRFKVKDVNKQWSNCDIIITTTTITVGVDFTREHFHGCLVIGNKQCGMSRDIVQCMVRTRNLIDKQYYLIYNISKNTIYEDLHKEHLIKTTGTKIQIFKRYVRSEMTKKLDKDIQRNMILMMSNEDKQVRIDELVEQTFNQFEFMPDWLREIYYSISTEKMLNNTHYYLLLLHYTKSVGIELEVPDQSFIPDKLYKAEKQVVPITEVPDISELDYNHIKELLHTHQDITHEQFMMYLKYKMLHKMNIRDNDHRDNLWKEITNSYSKSKFYNVASEFSEENRDFNRRNEVQMYVETNSFKTAKYNLLQKVNSLFGINHTLDYEWRISAKEIFDQKSTIDALTDDIYGLFEGYYNGNRGKKGKKRGGKGNSELSIMLKTINVLYNNWGFNNIKRLKRGKKTKINNKYVKDPMTAIYGFEDKHLIYDDTLGSCYGCNINVNVNQNIIEDSRQNIDN